MSQSNPKQPKHFSRVLMGALPLGVLVLLGWLAVHLGDSRGSRADLAREVGEAEYLQGQMLRLEEVLTMSARLHARTGESRWKERYEVSSTELESVMTGVLAHSTEELAVQFKKDVWSASAQLRSGALQSFALVKLGQSDQAYGTLISGAYEHAQDGYQDGVLQHRTGLTHHHADRLKNIEAADQGLVVLACIVLFLIAGLGACAIRLAMKGAGYRESLSGALREHRSLLAALDCAPDGVIITDRRTTITYVNAAYCRLSGYPREALIGTSATVLRSKETIDEVYAELWSTLKRGDEWSGRILNRRCTGPNQFEDHWSYLHISQLIDEFTERSTGFIGIQRDISAEIRAESEAELREDSSAGLMRVSRKLEGAGTVDERLTSALRELTACKGFREDLGAAILRLGEGSEGEALLLASCGDFGRFGSFASMGNEEPLSKGETRRKQVFLGLSDDILPADELAGYLLLSFDAGDNAEGMMIVGCEGRMAGDPVFAEALESASGLFANMTMRAKMRLELESALESANHANRSKTEFLANISHEVRTPMTSIMGYSDLLLDANRSPEDQEQAGVVIHQCAQELMELIDGLIDLSSVEAGLLTAKCEPSSPVELATRVIRELMPSAEAKGIRLQLEVEGRVPESISTDPGRLRQILLNLVGNAIKFTEIGSVILRVRLAQRDASGELVFEVVDTGIGVSKEQQKVLFCAFQQGDRSIARRFGGTGLGLTISRALARLLDGTISIKSKVSVGSTFSLCLPAGELENLELIYWQESSGQSTQEVLSNEPSQVLPYRLLLAEDNAVNQLVVTRILEKAGATVDTVSNGVEAMERVIEAAEQGVPYDAVLMDLSMPQMDGLTATRNLREGGMSLPIIALTADARPSTGTECMEAGCNGYTIKPVNREQLFDLLVDQIRGGSACRSPVAED